MAVQNLVAQRIVFISPTSSFDESAIFANSLMQTLMQNSTGGDVSYGYESFANISGNILKFQSYFFVEAYVLPAFQATIQQNIATLQSDFPQYTVVTWGYSIQFGS